MLQENIVLVDLLEEKNTLHMFMLWLMQMWFGLNLRSFCITTFKDYFMWRLVEIVKRAQAMVEHIVLIYINVGKTLLYKFPCKHILTCCFCSINFRSFVQHYYTIQSYFSTWAPLFLTPYTMSTSGHHMLVQLLCL